MENVKNRELTPSFYVLFQHKVKERGRVVLGKNNNLVSIFKIWESHENMMKKGQ